MESAYELAKGVAVNLIRGLTISPLTRELIAEKVDMALSLDPRWKAAIDRDELIKHIETQYDVWIGKPRTLEDPTGHKPWLPARRATITWRYWERYRQLLKERWPAQSLDGLDELTDEVLMRLEDPTRDGPWDRRGLVVGHVQSGKTANYIGLINKAVDAGYRVVVVLAGIHKSLRSQTQIRLDEGFLGYESVAAVAANQRLAAIGVGKIDPSLRPNSITNRNDDGDFKRAVADRFQINPGLDPLLFVIKKNASVLRNLLEWVEWVANSTEAETGRRIVRGVPLLVIDDEADHASVDTKEQTFDEKGNPDPDYDPTIINRQIRKLLHCFEKAAYVGYTATPFANIFIHESGRTTEEGDDLFPRSFVISLPAPSDYIGPLRLFGMDANPEASLLAVTGLPLVRAVSDAVDLSDDTKGWMPSRHKKDHIPTYPSPSGLPASLEEAVLSFVISCAARRARGEKAVHNSMLVHVTRFTDVQDKVFEQVRRYRDELVGRLRWGEGAAPDSLIEHARHLWERDYVPTTAAISGAHAPAAAWDAVQRELWEAASAIQLKRINGCAPDVLDYESHRETGLSVIVVGGDKLARGLTLEGLTVSYFLRAAKMYDTLMQMGRWFGYRPGYLDLCRMYMTPDLQEWFEHITAANEELRQEFDRMAASGGTPRDYGLRVKSHPSLLVTSRVKMRNGTELDLSFAGGINETTVFHVEPHVVQANVSAAESLVERLGAGAIDPWQPRPDNGRHTWRGSRLWTSVKPDVVTAFLRAVTTHPLARRVNGDLMAEYIEKAVRVGELTSWSVALIGKDNDAAADSSDDPNVDLAEDKGPWRCKGLSQPLNRVDRTGHLPDQGPLRFTVQRLLNPRDEAIDLDLDEYSKALDQTRCDWRPDAARSKRREAPDVPTGPMVRMYRPPTRALLLIYPLRARVAKAGAARVALLPGPLVGFAVSFPVTTTGTTVKYLVNNVYWEQEYGADA